MFRRDKGATVGAKGTDVFFVHSDSLDHIISLANLTGKTNKTSLRIRHKFHDKHKWTGIITVEGAGKTEFYLLQNRSLPDLEEQVKESMRGSRSSVDVWKQSDSNQPQYPHTYMAVICAEK